MEFVENMKNTEYLKTGKLKTPQTKFDCLKTLLSLYLVLVHSNFQENSN